MAHTCHWPDCNTEVPPAMRGCRKHWFTLPKLLRHKIWKEYVPGQEVSKTPSDTYMEVYDEVQYWIRNYIETKKKER